GIAQEMAELRGESAPAKTEGRIMVPGRRIVEHTLETRTPFEQCRDLFAKYGKKWPEHIAELSY
ncbi:MAG: hypothetical protein KC897_13920, partial [Candidatus Omnitrophica bacterium]|nr:hypothetical protein [Candidatus Omnitrophota bacterium]